MSSLQSNIKFWLCAGGKTRGRKRKGVHLDDPGSPRAHRWSLPKDSSVLTVEDVVLQLSDPQHHRASLGSDTNHTTLLHPNHQQQHHNNHIVPKSAKTSTDASETETTTTSPSSSTSPTSSATTTTAATASAAGGRMTAGRVTSGYSLSLASQRPPQQSSSSSQQHQQVSQESADSSSSHQPRTPDSPSQHRADMPQDLPAAQRYQQTASSIPATTTSRDFRRHDVSGRRAEAEGGRGSSVLGGDTARAEPRGLAREMDKCHIRSAISGSAGVASLASRFSPSSSSHASSFKPPLASSYSSYSSHSSSCVTSSKPPWSAIMPFASRLSTTSPSASTSSFTTVVSGTSTSTTRTTLTTTATESKITNNNSKATSTASSVPHATGSFSSWQNTKHQTGSRTQQEGGERRRSAGGGPASSSLDAVGVRLMSSGGSSARQASVEQDGPSTDHSSAQSWGGDRRSGGEGEGMESAEDNDSNNLSKSSTLSSLCSNPDLEQVDEGTLVLHHHHHQQQQQQQQRQRRGHCMVTKSATTSTLLTTSHRVSFDCDSSPSDSEDKEKASGSRPGDGVDGDSGGNGRDGGKSGGKEKKRRFGRKMLPKPLRRSQSAGCAKDVPAHALFLQHNPGDKGIDTIEERLGRTALTPGDEGEKQRAGDDWGGSDTRRPPPPHARPIHKTASADAAMMARDEYGNITCQTKGKKSLAKTMKRKLLFLRRRHTDTTLGTVMKGDGKQVNKIHPDDALQWSRSFESLLLDKTGLELFRGFLRSEFSDENLEFWIAVEEFKLVKPSKIPAVAHKIYTDFVAPQAQREINLDSKTRLRTLANLSSHSKDVFEEAQRKVQALMEKDSYPRFLESDVYQRIIRSQKS